MRVLNDSINEIIICNIIDLKVLPSKRDILKSEQIGILKYFLIKSLMLNFYHHILCRLFR